LATNLAKKQRRTSGAMMSGGPRVAMLHSTQLLLVLFMPNGVKTEAKNTCWNS